MASHQITLKNQELKPKSLTVTLPAAGQDHTPEISIRIGDKNGFLGSKVEGHRKFIFVIEQIDEETPSLVEGDEYVFKGLNKPGNYNISCVTFPKLSCAIQIKQSTVKAKKTKKNLSAIEGLESVEEVKEQQAKEQHMTREGNEGANFHHWINQGPQAHSNTPIVTKSWLDLTVEEPMLENRYLQYFKEEFKFWNNVFEPKKYQTPPKDKSQPEHHSGKLEEPKNDEESEKSSDQPSTIESPKTEKICLFGWLEETYEKGQPLLIAKKDDEPLMTQYRSHLKNEHRLSTFLHA